ncbi:alpha/beta hydrolase family protein [Aquisalinus flavus]|uniref:Peptidase S9 n=1 Tax=Aquisalinus flavus TaxID=1526572 RepID=A0A8J2V691_9PROT|nr:prolyl oligopeptidase family serine peptidase [Aquisalinus flavus]MBD0427520.1 S9 family peptidase [Aquisalinus flavus]GGD01628.1 peptidase S9 [Aquisalinus flavus]
MTLNRLIAAVLVSAASVFGAAMTANAQETLPFEAFAQDPTITDVEVSPDGRWLSVVQRNSIDGDPFLGIYDAQDLSKGRIRTYGARGMSVNSAQWINEDYLLVVFTQQFSEGENTYRISKIASIHRERGSFIDIPKLQFDRRTQGAAAAELEKRAGAAAVISTLPADPDHVMVSYVANANGVRAIAKVRIDSGVIVSETTGNTRYGGYGVDAEGDIRFASYNDRSTGEQVFVARIKGETDWTEIGRSGSGGEAISQVFSPIGFLNADNPNELFVVSNHDADTAGIFAYDLASQEYTELLFRHPKYDAAGIVTIRDPEDRLRQYLTGFAYDGRGGEVYWIDPAEKAFDENLDELLPNANNDTISASHDLSVRVIRSNGPRTPSTYYLYDEAKGGLQVIGKSMPALTEEALSDMEFVTYTARDGYEIPALVTVPDGEGPFPAIVMPHGGPTARDYWGFDLWVQLFAHHGYAVIQPQYRISTGFGKKHLQDGFGEWGMLQQDDIDDAGQYLVDQGIADPDRLAIMGWSYGGYSSFIGSARDPNPYKCAIPGAGVGDMAQFRAWLYSGGSRNDPLTQYRNTVEGLNPLDLVSSVDVPVLVIHGTEDERVPISHSDKFVAALKREGKEHKYIKLDGANHFFGTIYYRHWMEMFPAMIDWLDNTCGLKEE